MTEKEPFPYKLTLTFNGRSSTAEIKNFLVLIENPEIGRIYLQELAQNVGASNE